MKFNLQKGTIVVIRELIQIGYLFFCLVGHRPRQRQRLCRLQDHMPRKGNVND